jgi:L-threonylcarbamoyladenylate synthase
VAIPTETVYGLAGNIYSETAINKIFETKKTASLQPIDRSYRFYGKLEEIVCEVPEKARTLQPTSGQVLTLVLKKEINGSIVLQLVEKL